MIKIGDLNFNNGYVGSAEVNKIYLGSTVVYENAPENTTFLYTTTDGEIIIIDTSKWSASIISNTYSGGQGTLVFEGTLTSIPASGFTGCGNLETIVIPEGIRTIQNAVFSGLTNLTECTVPSSVNDMKASIWRGCRNLTAVNGLDNLTITGENAGSYNFYNCANLRRLYIPQGITGLGANYAAGSGIGEVYIPDSVTQMTGRTFESCRILTKIVCDAVIAPEIGANTFNGLPYDGELIIPEESNYETWYSALGEGWRPAPPVPTGETLDVYYTTTDGQPITLNSTGWTEGAIVSNTYEDGQGILSISTEWAAANNYTWPQRAFYGISNLKSIDSVPAEMYSMASNTAMFMNSSACTYIDFSNYAGTPIYLNFVRGCRALKTLYLPSTKANFSNTAFQDCRVIEDIYLPVQQAPSFSAPTSGILSSSCTVHIPTDATGYDRWALPSGWILSYDL